MNFLTEGFPKLSSVGRIQNIKRKTLPDQSYLFFSHSLLSAKERELNQEVEAQAGGLLPIYSAED